MKIEYLYQNKRKTKKEEKKSEEEKKERYLFICCAGSGYQKEIAEFLKNIYIRNGEYYDHLQIIGSVYPLPLRNGLYELFYLRLPLFLRKNLLKNIHYLVKNNNLTKIVVVSEPKCALYNDMFNMSNVTFLSQKKAFKQALIILHNFLIKDLSIDNLEAWHMFLENKEALFEKVYNSKAKEFYLSKLK